MAKVVVILEGYTLPVGKDKKVKERISTTIWTHVGQYAYCVHVFGERVVEMSMVYRRIWINKWTERWKGGRPDREKARRRTDGRTSPPTKMKAGYCCCKIEKGIRFIFTLSLAVFQRATKWIIDTGCIKFLPLMQMYLKPVGSYWPKSVTQTLTQWLEVTTVLYEFLKKMHFQWLISPLKIKPTN